MKMSNWMKVMTWELKRNLTNKTFLISMLITPLIMIAFGALPSLLAVLESERLQTVYVVDELGIFEKIELHLPENIQIEQFTGEISGLEAIIEEEPDTSFIVLNEESLNSGVIAIMTYQEGMPELGGLNSAINQVIQDMRFEASGIDAATAQLLTTQLSFPVVSLRAELEDPFARIIPAAFAALLLFSISITGTMTFQSAIQEKKDKMAELILSSVTPFDMMQGKVVGYFALGIIQTLLWLSFAIPVAIFRFDIPIFEHLFVPILPVMLFFTLVGNLMFSALFASMGATIDDIQEAGNFQGMIMVLPWLPFLFISPVVANPNGVIALVASYFPLTSPGVMTIRLAMLARIPITDVVISGIILLVSTFLIIKLSGKIFKTGMLMYGKNASFAEIIKWIKH